MSAKIKFVGVHSDPLSLGTSVIFRGVHEDPATIDTSVFFRGVDTPPQFVDGVISFRGFEPTTLEGQWLTSAGVIEFEKTEDGYKGR